MMILRVLCLALAVAVGMNSTASGHVFRYFAFLTGEGESPPNDSAGVGTALITADLDINEMRVEVSFSELTGNAILGQIHAPTTSPGAGVAPAAVLLPDFPIGVHNGASDHFFDLGQGDTYTQDFINQVGGGSVAGAYSALITAFDSGKAYLDLLSSKHEGPGEIRGFFVNLIGDFNTNGVVDAADYTVWRDDLGETGEGLFADTNNDNVVDETDYIAWKVNFGQVAIVSGDGSGGGSIGVESIPEPSAILLAIFAAGTFGFAGVARVHQVVGRDEEVVVRQRDGPWNASE